MEFGRWLFVTGPISGQFYQVESKLTEFEELTRMAPKLLGRCFCELASRWEGFVARDW